VRFAGEAFNLEGESDQVASYSPQERAEDKMLLRSLQRGDMGRGPNVDKAIQDLIDRINNVNQMRGVWVSVNN